MLQLGASPTDLHKTAKNINVNNEEDKYSDSNIFGWCTYNESNDRRNAHVQWNLILPPTTFGFCSKPEVYFESNLGNRVPWGNNKFFEDVSVFTTGGVKNWETVSGYSWQRSADSSPTNKIVRCSCLNNSGYFASSDEFLIYSATANKSVEKSSDCTPQLQFKGGTSVMDPKSPYFQCVLLNSA